MTQTNGLHNERPAGELVKDLSTQVSTLIRQELELARLEMAEKGKQAGIGAGMLGGAGIVALFGVGALTATAILALDTALAGWLAALIVTVAWFAIAGVLALLGKGRAQRAVPPAPEQTVESVRHDLETIQEARR